MRCFALLVVPALLGLCYAGVNDDQGGAANQGAAYQPNNQGGNSQDFGAPNRVQPQIVPMGGDSGGEEGNVVSMTGFIPAQSGGAGGAAGGSFGAIPPQTGAAGQGAAGGSSNSFDTGAGYAGAGVNMGPGGSSGAAGADAGLVMQHQDLQGSSSGMSGAAVAGVVAGVVVIGAVGTAIAVVALKAKA